MNIAYSTRFAILDRIANELQDEAIAVSEAT